LIYIYNLVPPSYDTNAHNLLITVVSKDANGNEINKFDSSSSQSDDIYLSSVPTTTFTSKIDKFRVYPDNQNSNKSDVYIKFEIPVNMPKGSLIRFYVD